MPALNCPFLDCDFVTEDVDDVGAAAQLNIHAIIHQQGGGATLGGSTKQRPPKIERPTISVGCTEEQWNTVTKRWNLFKPGTDIPNGQVPSQLWQCCDPDLEEDLFKDVYEIQNISEDDLLQAIKRLAVISKATSVRKAELFSMKQDYGQPIRTFAAKVKGKAQICVLSKKCPNVNCQQMVDYSNDIVKYVLISGICDEEIKKDILGHENLDAKTLNDTIAIIENKEMASRAMLASSGESTNAVHQEHSNVSKKLPLETEAKLKIKTPCKSCQRQIVKFKLRRGTLKEFSHCVQCWRKLNNKSSSPSDSQGAIFDVLASVDDHTAKPNKLKQSVTLKHHIFDGTYGWMAKESRKQPSINLMLSTNQQDYNHFNIPFPNQNPRNVSAVADTGAQSSLLGLNKFLVAGFNRSNLIRVEKRLYAANNEGINILGAVFVRLTGKGENGNTLQAVEMVYVSDSTEQFYLSRNAMEQLGVIPRDFPKIGAACAVSAVKNENVIKNDMLTIRPKGGAEKCSCLPRSQPPPRPSELPYEPTA